MRCSLDATAHGLALADRPPPAQLPHAARHRDRHRRGDPAHLDRRGLRRFVLAEFTQFGTNVIGITPGKTKTAAARTPACLVGAAADARRRARAAPHAERRRRVAARERQRRGRSQRPAAPRARLRRDQRAGRGVQAARQERPVPAGRRRRERAQLRRARREAEAGAVRRRQPAGRVRAHGQPRSA